MNTGKVNWLAWYLASVALTLAGLTLWSPEISTWKDFVGFWTVCAGYWINNDVVRRKQHYEQRK